MKREPAPITQSPYADYETMLGALETQLAKGPTCSANQITAADILWGIAFNWTMMFGIVPKKGRFRPLRRTYRRASGVPADIEG